MKVFVFDLDGVIRHWDPQIIAEAERAHGLPAGALPGTAFEPELLLAAVTGQISDAAWREEIATRLQQEYPEADGVAAVAQWSVPHGDVIEGAQDAAAAARKHGGVNETFTVRKISSGVGVERIFPLHSPMLASIDVVRRGRVRRAKLYYLRNLRGKAARIKERQTR